MKKRSERRKHCARAGCSKVWTPPARPPVANTQTHIQDRVQYTAPLASAQCNNSNDNSNNRISTCIAPYGRNFRGAVHPDTHLCRE